MIKDVLNNMGDWKMTSDFTHGQKPVFYELCALKNAISDYISQSQYICDRMHVECLREIQPTLSNYNIYGRMVHKKVEGCSHFYKLLSAYDKNDGWESPCNGMERDLEDFDPDCDFDQEVFFEYINKIMNLKYFNRIKQFMVRLFAIIYFSETNLPIKCRILL